MGVSGGFGYEDKCAVIALLRYKTVINTGIGAGISGKAIDNISDFDTKKSGFYVFEENFRIEI
mgnify:CR=1 FL=1